MQYKWWLILLVAVLSLNATTLSFADTDVMETEEVEAIIETPAEQVGEPEFEESETEDDEDERAKEGKE